MSDILVDILKVKDPYSGLGQFSLHFAEGLVAWPHGDHRATFLAPRGFTLPGATHYLRPDALKRYLSSLTPRYDLWHSLHQFPSFRPGPRTKWLLTVHDLNFLREKSPGKAARYLRRLQRNIDRADAITAISHFTRADIEQHIDLKGRPVHVVHNGARMPKGVPTARSGRPFFLALGVFKAKKEFHALLPMMRYFPGHDLVLAGNNDTAYGGSVRRQVREMGLEGQVRMPGAVDDQERFRLYTHCEAFLMPSVAEGFGLPVVEAMMLGKPVFLSRATSLPEIGGAEAFYFQGTDPRSMADTVQAGLAAVAGDPIGHAERSKAHAATFTWEECIRKYRAIYRTVLG